MIEVLKLFLLSWVVSQFTEILGELIDSKYKSIQLLKLMMTCSKCSSFWFILIFTTNIYTAALVSFMMFIYEKLIEKV
jgi:hypothetical protein